VVGGDDVCELGDGGAKNEASARFFSPFFPNPPLPLESRTET